MTPVPHTLATYPLWVVVVGRVCQEHDDKDYDPTAAGSGQQGGQQDSW